MPYTKQQIINQFLRTYPDASAQAEEYFDRAYRRLLGEARVKRSWITLEVVAGQESYALSQDLVEAEKVILATSYSSTEGYRGRTYWPLDEVWSSGSAEAGWSLSPDGSTGWRIHLTPPPAVSTSGGFPLLAIYGTEFISPALIDTLSETILDPSLLTSRMKEFACEDLEPEMSAYYRGEADRKTSELRAWLSERVSGERAQLKPSWMGGSWTIQ